jgi:hypothetical protein
VKLHSISVLIAIPYVLLTAYFGYSVFYLEKSEHLVFLILSFISLVVIYTLQPHIDYLWYRRHPQVLEQKEKVFLESFSSFYQKLNDQQKKKFEERIFIFKRAKSFKLIAGETMEMPEDFKIAIASQAVQLTLNLDDFLFKNFDNFFAYKHPFPSPKIQSLHSVEVDFEDNLAIFNMEMLINSINEQNRFFNIGIYIFSYIFSVQNKIFFKILPDEIFWEKVKNISGFNRETILLYTGYEPDQFSFLVSIFFINNENFKKELPQIYEDISRIFNYDNFLLI